MFGGGFGGMPGFGGPQQPAQQQPQGGMGGFGDMMSGMMGGMMGGMPGMGGQPGAFDQGGMGGGMGAMMGGFAAMAPKSKYPPQEVSPVQPCSPPPEFPQIGNCFTAETCTKLNMMGGMEMDLTLYVDHDNARQAEFDSFGGKVWKFFAMGQKITAKPQESPEREPISMDDMTSFDIPPFAQLQGMSTVTVNGAPQQCYVYYFDFMGMMQGRLYAYCIPLPDNKFEWKLARSEITVPMLSQEPTITSFHTFSQGVDESVWVTPIPVVPPVMFPVTISVRDATNRKAVPNTTIQLGSMTGQTDDKGNCSLSLEQGQYPLAARSAGFMDFNNVYDVHTPRTIWIMMCPCLQPGQARVVLTWGHSPLDLDLYACGSPGTINYKRRHVGPAHLDIDVRNGVGPETITWTQSSDEPWRISVHNYSGGAVQPDSAKVCIYGPQGLISAFTCPGADSSQRWWHVCHFNPVTYAIEPIQAISNSA